MIELRGSVAASTRAVYVTDFALALRRYSFARMTRLAPPLAIALLALAGCNSSSDDTSPTPVTSKEAEALEDAASMLDEQRLPDETPAPEPNPETDGPGQ